MRLFVSSNGLGKWHIATKKPDGWPSTVCGKFGFNVDMPWPEYRSEMPPDGDLCRACYKAGSHIVNVHGAGDHRAVSNVNIGTGQRRY